MKTRNIVDFVRRAGMTGALTDLLRTGAQRLIASAVEAELAGHMAQFSGLRTETGQAAVVRNGYRLCVLDGLRRAIRRRDVFPLRSLRYADPGKGLLSGAARQAARRANHEVEAGQVLAGWESARP